MESRKWGKNCILNTLFQKIKDIRDEMITQNLPLAISRARIFWSYTPESHLSYVDLIDIAAEGLTISVDKYVIPPGGYTRIFRSVSIGRMVSGFIEEYSNTLIHFYPNDKNKLYKANKLLKDKTNIDYDYVSEELTKSGTRNQPRRHQRVTDSIFVR